MCVYVYTINLNKLLSVRSIKNKKNESFNFTFLILSSIFFISLCRSNFLTYIIFLFSEELLLTFLRDGKSTALVSDIQLGKVIAVSSNSSAPFTLPPFSNIPIQFSPSVVSDSLPGFPVHHQLPELAQTHVHHFGDAMAIHTAHWTVSNPSATLQASLPGSGSMEVSACGFLLSVFTCLSLQLGVWYSAALTSVTSLSQVPGPLWPSVTRCDLTSFTRLRRVADFSVCSAFCLLLGQTSHFPKDHDTDNLILH